MNVLKNILNPYNLKTASTKTILVDKKLSKIEE